MQDNLIGLAPAPSNLLRSTRVPPTRPPRLADRYAVHPYINISATMRSRLAGDRLVLDAVQSSVPCRQWRRLCPR